MPDLPWRPGEVHPTGGYTKVNDSPNHDGSTSRTYSLDGFPHRLDGPAEIRVSDTGVVVYEFYGLRGLPHRTDGPAMVERDVLGQVIREDYLLHGERHRLDGPAEIAYGDGPDEVDVEEWWVHGKRYTHAEYALLREALDGGAPEEWAIAYAEGAS